MGNIDTGIKVLTLVNKKCKSADEYDHYIVVIHIECLQEVISAYISVCVVHLRCVVDWCLWLISCSSDWLSSVPRLQRSPFSSQEQSA